jgi:hypothetical protein
MGLFDFFKRKTQTSNSPVEEKNKASTPSTSTTKEDIIKAIFEQMAQQSPSQHFVQGSVFDIVRQQHSAFEQIVRNHDVMSVHKFFINSYLSFCSNPNGAGFINANALNVDKNDTDPRKWNTDIFDLQSGDVVALCYMPIIDQAFDARIIGVVLGQKGDGYYYCNLSKDNRIGSDVMRNKAILGIEKAGEVNGRGFELMKAFVSCISNNYYKD